MLVFLAGICKENTVHCMRDNIVWFCGNVGKGKLVLSSEGESVDKYR